MDLLQDLPNIYPLPFYIKNHEGRFILTNDAFARLYDIEVNNLLAKGSLAFDFSFERDLEVLKTNDSVVIEECFKLDNGKKLWFSTIKKAFQQADGRRYLISVSSDVSHYKVETSSKENLADGIHDSQKKTLYDTAAKEILKVTEEISKESLSLDNRGRIEKINNLASELLIKDIPSSISNLLFEKESISKENEGLRENTQSLVSGKKTVVLLVEDNENNLELTFTQLTSKGILVDVAINGEDAVSKAKRKAYDLILMDIQMPIVDGITATKQIRQLENSNARTSIIAFTANIARLTTEEYKQNGFTDFLPKPYSEPELLALVSRYIDTNTVVSTNTPKLYDFSGLGDLSKDAVFIQKMQNLFIQTVPEQLEELDSAYKNEDWTLVASIAHKLKSTYGNIKVIEPAAAMKKIETYALDFRNTSEIPDLLSQAKDITFQVIDLFSKELKA